jgi:histone-lysine N-methyltransferase SETMAR
MLHDNARPHAAHATRDTLGRFGWGVLDHSPYSPDLSPCDYHVFGPLKKTLKGRQFNSDEAVLEAVVQWFIQQTVSFAEGITKLVQHWDKCLNSGGQYL